MHLGAGAAASDRRATRAVTGTIHRTSVWRWHFVHVTGRISKPVRLTVIAITVLASSSVRDSPSARQGAHNRSSWRAKNAPTHSATQGPNRAPPRFASREIGTQDSWIRCPGDVQLTGSPGLIVSRQAPQTAGSCFRAAATDVAKPARRRGMLIRGANRTPCASAAPHQLLGMRDRRPAHPPDGRPVRQLLEASNSASASRQLANGSGGTYPSRQRGVVELMPIERRSEPGPVYAVAVGRSLPAPRS
jgi:hypothetical protein